MLRLALQALRQVRLHTVAVRAMRILLLTWIGVFVVVYAFQRKLLFMPDQHRTAPEAAGLTGVIEDIILTPDGYPTKVVERESNYFLVPPKQDLIP